jgi:hypothetical protein
MFKNLSQEIRRNQELKMKITRTTRNWNIDAYSPSITLPSFRC